MKKIVFVIEQLCTGGAERVTSELANYICRNDYEVHIITYSRNIDIDYYLDDKVIRHNLNVTDNNQLVRIVKRHRKLKKLLEEITPYCIVSLAMPITNFWLSLALPDKDIPIILSERNDPGQYPTSKFERFLRDNVYKKCNGLVFQTANAQKYFSNSITQKSVIIHNPVNSRLPDRFLGEKSNSIVNFCRLAKQKNLDLLIDAFHDITSDFPNYSLYIYGDGPEKEHLRNKIENRGLDKSVFLQEYCNEIHEKIKNAALFVSSSNFEGISNSMIEALALGIPTICTDCPSGGAREMIENGVNGILVPVNNRIELASAMKQVLEDKVLAEKLSDEGYKIRNELSIKNIGQQWICYIENVVNRRW